MALVRSAESQIRATALGRGKWGGPISYLKLIAQIAKSCEKTRGTFVYKVVFAYDKSPDPERARHIMDRWNTFLEAGVSHMLEMKHIDANWVVDFLIVDDHSLIIAFPQFKQQELRVGIKFVDQPKLVKQVANWYDEHLWEQASDVDIDEVQKIARVS